MKANSSSNELPQVFLRGKFAGVRVQFLSITNSFHFGSDFKIFAFLSLVNLMKRKQLALQLWEDLEASNEDGLLKTFLA